jgi:hypothetical protein
MLLGNRYTKEEDTFITEHYGIDMSIAQIANALTRTEGSVGNRAFKLRSAGRMKRPGNARSNGWTTSDEDFLYANWGKLNDETLCERLNRSLVALQLRAYLLGITKRDNRAYA